MMIPLPLQKYFGDKHYLFGMVMADRNAESSSRRSRIDYLRIVSGDYVGADCVFY
jgi:hypothetical protein